MKDLRFQWDPVKAESNEQKYGVSFEETISVFYDENGIEFYDGERSEWEDRFILLGFSSKLNLLIVCHCYREDDAVVRLISARLATKNEAKYYKR